MRTVNHRRTKRKTENEKKKKKYESSFDAAMTHPQTIWRTGIFYCKKEKIAVIRPKFKIFRREKRLEITVFCRCDRNECRNTVHRQSKP